MARFDVDIANQLLFELSDAWKDKKSGRRKVLDLLNSLVVRCDAMDKDCSFYERPEDVPIKRKSRDDVDTGQVLSMYNCGFTMQKIAEEMACSVYLISCIIGEARGRKNVRKRR